MKKKNLVFWIVSVSLIINFIFLYSFNVDKSPDQAIGDLYDAISIAEEKGVYKCCIEPACTMCYLGHWKFDKGTCYCDDAIAEGRDEDVCPACIKGLKEGDCNSAKDAEFCDV